MKRFASDRVAGLMERLGLEDDVAIESRLVSKTIEQAQTRVEGYNFDIRKRVVEFDDVINRQRETHLRRARQGAPQRGPDRDRARVPRRGAGEPRRHPPEAASPAEWTFAGLASALIASDHRIERGRPGRRRDQP